ncbi:MAG: polysaccharide deacetylase family protein [Candidatus Cloacimonetes bacterium]|nr:polysaccharide deacetylase family protein [Candidatus Cloacimonadota bacterium]
MIFTGDFELAWAVARSKLQVDPETMARKERENMPVILSLLERHQIPVTWATVGHLLLRGCEKGDHDWMERLPYLDDHFQYFSGDWFDVDPCASWDKAKAWYAPDLVQMILDSSTRHEIGCHTFSHVDCRDKYCPAQVLDDELTACEEAAKPWGIKFRSMAFPAGTAGNYAILKKHGIMIYRRRVSVFELAYPFRDEHGILVSPTGYGLGFLYQRRSLEQNIKRYHLAIDKAIRTNTISHFWFHPSADPEVFTGLLPGILEYCARKREEGLLWIATMDTVQTFINDNKVL